MLLLELVARYNKEFVVLPVLGPWMCDHVKTGATTKFDIRVHTLKLHVQTWYEYIVYLWRSALYLCYDAWTCRVGALHLLVDVPLLYGAGSMWASACEIADTMLYLHTGEYNSLLEKVVQVPNRLPSFSIMSSKQYHFNSLSHCYYLKISHLN